jgi:hypothetical protein
VQAWPGNERFFLNPGYKNEYRNEPVDLFLLVIEPAAEKRCGNRNE